MALTTAQAEVIELLRNGWGIGQSATMDGRLWIQKGGAGRGGECRTLRRTIFRALQEAGAIVMDGERNFPTTKWKLSPNYDG